LREKSRELVSPQSIENIPTELFPKPVDITLSTSAYFDRIIYKFYTKYRGVNMCGAQVVVFVDKSEKTIDITHFICYYVFVLKRE